MLESGLQSLEQKELMKFLSTVEMLLVLCFRKQNACLTCARLWVQYPALRRQQKPNSDVNKCGVAFRAWLGTWRLTALFCLSNFYRKALLQGLKSQDKGPLQICLCSQVVKRHLPPISLTYKAFGLLVCLVIIWSILAYFIIC